MRLTTTRKFYLYCNFLFDDNARRHDIALLVQFLDCSLKNRRLATVENVHILLLECLTDPAPAHKTQSNLLRWMIWLFQGKTEFTCPDRCIVGIHAALFLSRLLIFVIAQDATRTGACEVRVEVCGMVPYYNLEEYQG
jgi:hypothetical protein